MIPGLRYIPNYLPDETLRERLLFKLDVAPWSRELASRRVQHYGYRYDYRAQEVSKDAYLGSLPEPLATLAAQLHYDGYFKTVPNQVIVNEYNPGQGIGAHVDCIPCFGPAIASISLGSACEMEFVRVDGSRATTQFQLLEPGSLLVLEDEARYHWTHQIRGRIHDNGVMRGRRVSVTFRTVRLTGEARDS